MGTVLDVRQRSAIQRAFASGLVDGVRRVGFNTYRVPSASRPDVAYLVTTNRRGDKWFCTCQGSGHPACQHRAAAWVAWVRERGTQTAQTTTGQKGLGR